MVRGDPTALTCFFVGFRTDFVTSVRVSVAFVGVLALAGLRPAGARNPQGGTSSTPAPLGYVPGGDRGCRATMGRCSTDSSLNDLPLVMAQ